MIRWLIPRSVTWRIFLCLGRRRPWSRVLWLRASLRVLVSVLRVVKPPIQVSVRTSAVRIAELETSDAVFERTAKSAGFRNSNPREADFLLFRSHYSLTSATRERDERGLEACLDAQRRGKDWAFMASTGSTAWSSFMNSELGGCSTRVVLDLCMFGATHRAPLQILSSLRCFTNLRHLCDRKLFPHSHTSGNSFLPKLLPLAFWDMVTFHLIKHFEIDFQQYHRRPGDVMRRFRCHGHCRRSAATSCSSSAPCSDGVVVFVFLFVFIRCGCA